jgi:hypothetical protein
MKKNQVKSRVILVLVSAAILGLFPAMASPDDAGSAAPPEWLCNLSSANAAEVPASNPAPILASTSEYCGACSVLACRGHSVASLCRNSWSVVWGKCFPDNVGNICAADGLPRCYCGVEA